MQSSAKGVARVLLLPLKDAGAGLNLSEAQHVLLMEPSIDPACEAQARVRHMWKSLRFLHGVSCCCADG
jgi:hypothetical protein